MSREWTERHIRELIEDELKGLKFDGEFPGLLLNPTIRNYMSSTVESHTTKQGSTRIWTLGDNYRVIGIDWDEYRESKPNEVLFIIESLIPHPNYSNILSSFYVRTTNTINKPILFLAQSVASNFASPIYYNPNDSNVRTTNLKKSLGGSIKWGDGEYGLGGLVPYQNIEIRVDPSFISSGYLVQKSIVDGVEVIKKFELESYDQTINYSQNRLVYNLSADQGSDYASFPIALSAVNVTQKVIVPWDGSVREGFSNWSEYNWEYCDSDYNWSVFDENSKRNIDYEITRFHHTYRFKQYGYLTDKQIKEVKLNV